MSIKGIIESIKHGVSRIVDTSSTKYVVRTESNNLNLYLSTFGEELETVNIFGTFNKLNSYGDLWYFNLYQLEHFAVNNSSIVAKGILQLTALDTTEYVPFFLYANDENCNVKIGSYNINQSSHLLIQY